MEIILKQKRSKNEFFLCKFELFNRVTDNQNEEFTSKIDPSLGAKSGVLSGI